MEDLEVERLALKLHNAFVLPAKLAIKISYFFFFFTMDKSCCSISQCICLLGYDINQNNKIISVNNKPPFGRYI